MKIEDYKNICDNVEVSDTCREGYHAAMEQICSENKKERKKQSRRRHPAGKMPPSALYISGR